MRKSTLFKRLRIHIPAGGSLKPMLPWSRNWLSLAVKKDPAVSKALTDLTQLIHDHEDAAKPASCRRASTASPPAELDLFRPGWKLFTVVCLVCGVGGVAFSLVEPEFGADVWADLALGVTVPVFVLGLSVVTLARSMSESGRFAVEYLNESCRMASLCCLTLVAVLLAFVGRFLVAVPSFPTVVAGGLCAASLGAAITCLAMLAFVMLETIRCSLPGKAVEVVSNYAARKLCHAYLKEAYLKLLTTKHKECLEEWCVEHGKAIHPPSKYYGHYFVSDLKSDKASKDCKIELFVRRRGRSVFKDYDLDALRTLNDYLDKNDAELYLSPHESESEHAVLGILSCAESSQTEAMKSEVKALGNRAIRFRSFPFQEETEDFWDRQESALNEAMERAVGKADPIQVRAWLDAVNRPLVALRETRSHRIIREVFGQCVRRGYDFLRLYIVALNEILTRLSDPKQHRTQLRVKLARVLLKSVWEEARSIVHDLDYHTMELFTWLVRQMYSAVKAAGDNAGVLLEMRARFGGFYAFADGWLDGRKIENVKAADKMRLVLQEGLTNWLLMVLERPEEGELVRQLCDAGRGIVFGREGITFERAELVARHFVLAGHIMGRPDTASVRAGAVERLFCEEYSHDAAVDFKDLVDFYLSYPFPPDTLDEYLHLFFTPEHRTEDLLTGSSSSSGDGSTGVHEMTLAFIYLAGFSLGHGASKPEPIPKDLSHEISDDAISLVADLFGHAGIAFGLNQLKAWRDRSKEREKEADAKKIADAELDDEKVGEWEAEFWEAYTTSSPILTLCLNNGNYEIDNGALAQHGYRLAKMAVIEEYPISGADGARYGRSHGRFRERKLLEAVTGESKKSSQIEGGLSESMARAVDWLTKERCDGDSGIVVVKSMHGLGAALFRDERFLPSWREDVRSKGFDGFYDGFPVVWLKKGGDEDETGASTDEKIGDRVVAVDLRGWKGIKVRECIVTQSKFGELEIRTWSQKEIQRALESGELKEEDVDKAKGWCPVEVSLYWQFSGDDLPRVRAFELHPPENRPEQGDRPEECEG